MKVYFHLRFGFEKVFVTANFTIDLNTATFEEMQSLAGIGHGRAQAIFDVRASISRPLTLLDLLEMGIPADVVKALVDDLDQQNRRTFTNYKKAGHNLQKTQSPLSLRPQYPPTYTLPT